MKHLLSLADLEQGDFDELLERACRFAQAPPEQRRLTGRSIGIEFRKTSTRTRTSFAVAAVRLGAHPMIYGPADLQTNTGESIEDSTRVLSSYVDALVIRTAARQSELQQMAAVDRMPIINAMSAEEHPTQALSDFAMMKREFGTLEGLHVVYSGEGNNTAVALALGASRIRGLHLQLHMPAGFGLSSEVLRDVDRLSSRYGGHVQVFDRPFEPRAAGKPVHVVYTTRWQTTGTSKSDPLWREKFAPFCVTVAMLGTSSALFMHDLPAVRGEDCESAVLDGPSSIAFEQARQKLFTAMAVIDWCVEN